MIDSPPTDELVSRMRALVRTRRNAPESTYRLQFHAGFTFRDVTAIVPYLHELGITHCYASPYLKAKPGSTHGYDVIDHHSLNPEIGTEQDFHDWLAALKQHEMGHILDIVPNHVGVATNENIWWNDVLENGPESRFAGYFDISWHGSSRPELQGKVLLPLLGQPYAKVLEAGQLKLAYEEEAFFVRYYDRRFPISPQTYPQILGQCLANLGQLSARDRDAVKGVLDSNETTTRRNRLSALISTLPGFRHSIDEALARFNGTPGDPASFDLLDHLLCQQFYRLAYWRVAPDEINYRRFFDINDLAALSMEKPEVFESTHEFIFRLLGEGKLQGVRIDHPDGLLDPEEYLLRLQHRFVKACARFEGIELDPAQVTTILDNLKGENAPHWPLWVAVEKILGTAEQLPSEWAVDGTSGYDFLNRVNGLFVSAAGEQPFSRIYEEWIGQTKPYADLIYEKKRLILRVSFSSELHMLAHQLCDLAQKDRRSRDFTEAGLRNALGEVIACFPVYRSYISSRGVHDTDCQYINTAVEDAMARNPEVEPDVFHFIADTLLQKRPRQSDEISRIAQLRFSGKFQQLTAPVTAKGIEDTAFYVYNRLVSLNEVGGDPSEFGVSTESLHQYFIDRQKNWPFALSALSTHDTKRSEDVRARINVLSDVPEEWHNCLARWSRLNSPHRTAIDGLPVPDANVEYLLYQTLIGAWPIGCHEDAASTSFVERIQAYLEKALREAKVHTSWTAPNAAYEAAMKRFVERILNPEVAGEFLRDFFVFQNRISHHGMFNSLSQTLLRIAAPGAPDTFQGTELWDLSLVDPDNRRPVDYELRGRMLRDLKAGFAAAGEDRRQFARDLADSKEDGRVKLYATWRALTVRRENSGLFSKGEYLPARADGPSGAHVFGFARRLGAEVAIVVVPRLMSGLISRTDAMPVGEEIWHETELICPGLPAGQQFIDRFTGRKIQTASARGEVHIRVAEALNDFPLALLISA